MFVCRICCVRAETRSLYHALQFSVQYIFQFLAVHNVCWIPAANALAVIASCCGIRAVLEVGAGYMLLLQSQLPCYYILIVSVPLLPLPQRLLLLATTYATTAISASKTTIISCHTAAPSTIKTSRLPLPSLLLLLLLPPLQLQVLPVFQLIQSTICF